jgi:plastocyanin
MSHSENRPSRRVVDAWRLQSIPLTRRAVSAGVVAATCGAVARSAGGSAILGAAAAAATPESGGSCAAQPAASPASAASQVVIENFTFTPDDLTVAVGTEVTWTNRDDVPHTVTSDDKTAFASDLLDTGDTFAHRFDAPGTFPYFCSVHPMMTATVVVEA